MSKNQFNNQDIAYSWIINCAKQCLSHAFFLSLQTSIFYIF